MASKHNKITVTVAALLGLGITNAAHAGVSGSAALVSDYRFRGVSQTNQDPAVQAGIEYAHERGFYVGTWGSNISWLSDSDAAISSSLELDGYFGFRGKFSDSVSYDAGVLTYGYPGSFPDGFNRANTTELYIGTTLTATDTLSLGLKYSHAITDLFGFSDSHGSGYLDASLNWSITPDWTISAHGGKQWIENNQDFAYTDWKLGVTRSFANGYAITGSWTDTDADRARYTNTDGNHIADGRLSLALSKAL